MQTKPCKTCQVSESWVGGVKGWRVSMPFGGILGCLKRASKKRSCFWCLFCTPYLKERWKVVAHSKFYIPIVEALIYGRHFDGDGVLRWCPAMTAMLMAVWQRCKVACALVATHKKTSSHPLAYLVQGVWWCDVCSNVQAALAKNCPLWDLCN